MLKKFTYPTIFMFIFCFALPMNAPTKESQTLRLALLPIPDVLPVYVAIENGYFDELGLTVEPLAVGSAVERDQLMQAGKADGMINELSGAANFNREKVQVKIVAVARSPLGNSPLFRILAAPGSHIKTIKDLAGVPIGISKNTVIEYITTRLLESGGLKPNEIEYQSIPVLPERLQLLLQGQVKAVTLPDPLGVSAMEAGAVEVVSDLAQKEVSQSVITFTVDATEEKSELVKNFMIAWNRAAKELNEHPGKYKALMLKKIRVPKNIQDEFTIPPMPTQAIPSKKQWDDTMSWMLEKKLINTPLKYEDSVTEEFLVQ